MGQPKKLTACLVDELHSVGLEAVKVAFFDITSVDRFKFFVSTRTTDRIIAVLCLKSSQMRSSIYLNIIPQRYLNGETTFSHRDRGFCVETASCLGVMVTTVVSVVVLIGNAVATAANA